MGVYQSIELTQKEKVIKFLCKNRKGSKPSGYWSLQAFFPLDSPVFDKTKAGIQ